MLARLSKLELLQRVNYWGCLLLGITLEQPRLLASACLFCYHVFAWLPTPLLCSSMVASVLDYTLFS